MLTRLRLFAAATGLILFIFLLANYRKTGSVHQLQSSLLWNSSKVFDDSTVFEGTSSNVTDGVTTSVSGPSAETVQETNFPIVLGESATTAVSSTAPGVVSTGAPTTIASFSVSTSVASAPASETAASPSPFKPLSQRLPTPSNESAVRAWYAALHNDITSGRRPNPRFIVFRPIGGYGNRMLGLASALLFGMLSERAVMVSGWPELPVVQQLPFEAWLWDSFPAERRSGLSSVDESYVDWCYFFKHGDVGGPFSDTDFATQHQQSVVAWTSNCPLYRYYLRNARYQSKLAEWFAPIRFDELTGFDLLGFAMRFFSLTPIYQARLDAYVKDWHGGSHRRWIGIQARTGGHQAAFGPDSNTYLHPADAAWLWRCADAMAQNDPSAVFVLATDADEVLRQGRSQYGDRLKTAEGKVVHVDRPHTYDSSPDRGLGKVVLDNHLLSLCDELVVTGGSTFGGVAAARGAILPMYVGRGATAMCKLADRRDSPILDAGIAANAVAWR